MIRFIALLFVIIAPLATPPAAAPAPETPIELTIPVKFSINFPAISPSSCWRVDQPADGRITAEVTGKGNWSVCIADTACPTDCMSNGRRSASTERLRPGRYYYVKVQTQTPGVTATLSIYPTAGGPPKPPPPSSVGISGSWSGTFRNTRGESDTETLEIKEESNGVLKGLWGGAQIVNGRRSGDAITWEAHVEARDYKVSGTISNDGKRMSLKYSVIDPRRGNYSGVDELARR